MVCVRTARCRGYQYDSNAEEAEASVDLAGRVGEEIADPVDGVHCSDDACEYGWALRHELILESSVDVWRVLLWRGL